MSDNKLTGKQQKMWILAAVSAPLAQMAGGTSWIIVLLTGILCGAFLLLVQRLRDHIEAYSNWFAAIVLIWALIKLLFLLEAAGNCWQADKSGYFVPVVLLLLAALSSQKGLAAAAGTACIVFCFMTAGYGITMIESVQNVRLEWMLGGRKEIRPELAEVFLLPIAMLLLPQQRNNTLRPTILAGLAVIGALFVLCINGVLSAAAAANYRNGFHEMSRAVSIWGTIERIESVTASVMVLGWFALFSIHFSTLREALRNWGNHGKTAVWMAASVTAVLYMLGVDVDVRMTLAVDVLLSALIAVQAGVALKRKLKNQEEN